MKIFIALLLSTLTFSLFAGEAPVTSAPQPVVSSSDCQSCCNSNCRVRRGLFGRRYFIRSTDFSSDQNSSTYSRTRTVTDGCCNVLRSRTFSRSTTCTNGTCSCQ